MSQTKGLQRNPNKELIGNLYQRDIGRIRRSLHHNLPTSVNKRIDHEFSKTISLIRSLEEALKSRSDNDIEYAVGDILSYMLEGMTNSNSSSNSRQSAYQNLLKKQQRELFISFGGMDSLLKLISPPLVPVDARLIAKDKISRQSDLWNEILVIFREMIMSIPSTADLFFTNQHIIFLFTLLSHHSVFDNVMNTLEELLAVREDTFSLVTIPRFYSLVRDFSARHLAHFCRVLSLVVFEPEDRQIMEGTQVIKSTELLQLRRNRMSRNSVGMVERNQNLVSCRFFFV